MKRYLLDTCTLIYAIGNDEKSRRISDFIDAYDVHASVINFWEIAIKVSMGKLILTVQLPELIASCQSALSSVLDITSPDIMHFQHLRTITKHNDPFDLMLVSQAKRCNLSLLTSAVVMLSEFKKSTTKI